MATLTLFRGTAPVIGYEADIGAMTADWFQIRAGSLELNFHGSFTYPDDEDIFGTFTRMDMRDPGGVYFEVTGLNHDIHQYFEQLFYGYGDQAQAWLLSGADIVIGTPGADSLKGYAGADLVQGGGGNDTFPGAQDGAVDTLQGGAGDDTYYLDPEDVVSEQAGEGFDRVYASGYSNGSSYVVPLNVEEFDLHIDWSGDVIGNDQANRITGGPWENLIEGRGGDDTIDGRDGFDTLRGGTGNDLYLGVSSWSQVQEDAQGGIDTVHPIGSYTLPANVENLVGAGELTGNELANRITGLGNYGSTFAGAGGIDTLEGGSGNDRYEAEAQDVIIDTGGYDTLEITATVFQASAWAAIEVFELTGPGPITAYGDARDNHIRLFNPDTADRLEGGAGNDTLEGGGGSDTLVGGTGNDSYWVFALEDTVTELAGGGWDTVHYTSAYWNPVDFVLPDHVEELVFEDSSGRAKGNALDNVIRGSQVSGVRLDGGAGADTLYGGTGSDTFVIDDAADVIVETYESDYYADDYAEATVSFDLRNAPLVEQLTLMGSANLSAWGNARPNTLYGNSGANVLTAIGGDDGLWGGAGNDTLIGSEGNDTLSGQEGADSMTGGAGDDTFYLDDPLDVAVESAGGGYDIIWVHGSAVMPANFEGLRVQGDALEASGSSRGNESIWAVGDTNVLHSGGGGNDTLRGIGGADTLYDDGAATFMEGGDGADTFHVTHAGSRVYDYMGNGTVYATVDFALGHGPDKLVLASGSRGTGNGLDNHITGNAGANLLEGASGKDTLTGGAGNDTLDGDAGIDDAVYSGNQSAYTVTRSGGAVIVSGPEGTDRLVGMDRIVFADGVRVLNANEPGWGTLSHIGGAHVVGYNVQAYITPVDADGVAGSFTYQWFREDSYDPWGGLTAIPGATSATYVLTEDDLGPYRTLSVRARFVDGQGNTETMWLSYSEQVIPQDPGGGVEGTSWSDRIDGKPIAERIDGDYGNDTLAGGGGNDTLSAGPGTDTAWLDIPLSGVSSYQIGWYYVMADTSQGDLQLYDFERFRFTDGLYGFDTDPGETIWQANALLWAWLGHAPDTQALSRMVHEADGNVVMYDDQRMAALATDVMDYYASGIGTRAMVAHLYGTIAGATPNEAQIDTYANQVGAGKTWATNADLLAYVAGISLNTDKFAGFAGSIVPLDPSFF